MELVTALFPVVVFFVTYQLKGIYAATVAIIAALALVIAYEWWRHGKVSMMLLASGGLALVLGAITLVLRNPLFIQWKLTVVNWLFAFAFLGSHWIGQKTLTEHLMGAALPLERGLWRQLNLMWAASFLIFGAANLFVVYHYDEATWAKFKLFGTLGFLVLTVVGQALWITLKTRDNVESEP